MNYLSPQYWWQLVNGTMPPRRNAAPAKPPALFEGCVVAISGKFEDAGHVHSTIEALIVHLGGKVSKSVTKHTTHVVSSQSDFDAETTKVAAAKSKDLPIVSIDWILDSEVSQKLEDCNKYKFGASQSSTNGLPARGKKRTHDDTANGNANGDDGSAHTKKSKANGQFKEENPKEEKTVAEGQFIKKKDVAIPVDEYCPLVLYSVYVDPADGMIWDASLNQSNSSHNNNKFYRIQV